MTRSTILLVDDEEDLLELIAFNLQKQGFNTIKAKTGEDGITLARTGAPALVVLDLMLPGMDGLDVCRALKQDTATRDIPIIMLTARDDESDIICGLELGADDYITKPFSPRVLMARIRNVLRRNRASVQRIDAPIVIGQLEVNPRTFQAILDRKSLELTQTEFNILYLLARSQGFVLTRQQLIMSLNGGALTSTTRAIDVQITSLRRKLETYGDYIETVRGVGYRFRSVEPEAEVQLAV